MTNVQVYLVAKKPGSKVSFDFTTAFGEVNLSYLRSREFGLGNIHCQVEGLGPEASMHIEGYWQLEFNILQYVYVSWEKTKRKVFAANGSRS